MPLPSRSDSVLDGGRAARGLIAVAAALLTVTVVCDAWLFLGGGLATPELATIFDATGERGLASFLSVTQTAFVAATLALLATLSGRAGRPRARKGWAVLAGFVAYLAVDDGVRLHEGVGTAFARSALSDVGLGAAFPSYYWQLLFGPPFAVLGLFMLAFLWTELRARRLRALVLGAFALLALAVGLDFVDGLAEDHAFNAYARLAATGVADAAAAALTWRPVDVVVHASRVLEEAIETFAFTLLWAALVVHLGGVLTSLGVQIGGPGRDDRPDAGDAPTQGGSVWVARAPAPVTAAPDAVES